jgi:DNA-binding transcriptional MerR regulator
MRVLLRDLRRYTGLSPQEGRFGTGMVREDLPALVLWLLEGDGSKDLPYPFSLTHLEFQQRCQQALQRAQGWVSLPRTLPERRAIEHLASLVRRFDKEGRFATAITRLERGWQAFCELRDVLQLSNAELPRADVRAQQRELVPLEARRMQEIKTALSDYRAELDERIARLQRDGSLSTSPYPVIVKYLDRYKDHLFGHPVRYDADGTMVAIVERTNNVLEHFFGDEKQHLRRRLGRAHLGRDLQDQPAQAALVANLRHPDYVRVLCGSLDHLPTAFAELDDQDLLQANPLSRTSRDTTLLQRIRAWLKGDKNVDNEPTS